MKRNLIATTVMLLYFISNAFEIRSQDPSKEKLTNAVSFRYDKSVNYQLVQPMAQVYLNHKLKWSLA